MNIQKIDGLYGLVLAGGQSTRMGKEKGMLEYHGMPQIEYVFQLLNNFCEKVYTSVGRTAQAAHISNPIEDQFDINSPLNGILSAFENHSHVAWLTVPIDMPMVNTSTIQYLIDKRNIDKVATCFYDSENQYPEPLLTIWEPKSANLLKGFFSAGKISPRDFLNSTEIQLLNIPDKKALQNVNTPEDFEAFSRSGENL